jgi:hypothetical protein
MEADFKAFSMALMALDFRLPQRLQNYRFSNNSFPLLSPSLLSTGTNLKTSDRHHTSRGPDHSTIIRADPRYPAALALPPSGLY